MDSFLDACRTLYDGTEDVVSLKTINKITYITGTHYHRTPVHKWILGSDPIDGEGKVQKDEEVFQNAILCFQDSKEDFLLTLDIPQTEFDILLGKLEKALHSSKMYYLVHQGNVSEFKNSVDPKKCFCSVFDDCWSKDEIDNQGLSLFALNIGCPVKRIMGYNRWKSYDPAWIRRLQDFSALLDGMPKEKDREWRCEKIDIKYILYDIFPDDEHVVPFVMAFAYPPF